MASTFKRAFGVGLLVLLGSAAAASPGSTQEHSAPNRLFLEVFGNGLIYSLNYERDLAGPLSLRVGAGGLPFESLDYALSFGMLGIREDYGVHSLMAGFGVGMLRNVDVWVTERSDETHVYGTGAIGYQYQPQPSGYFFRFSFTPGFTGEEVFLWGGVGFGWVF